MRNGCAASNSAAPRTGWSALRTTLGAAAATTPTAATGSRRSSAGSRSSPTGASRRRAHRPVASAAGRQPSRSLAQRACSARSSSSPDRYRASVAAVRSSAPSPTLPSTTRALRRSQRGSRPAMYQRPCRCSSVSSSASSRSSTSTHACTPTVEADLLLDRSDGGGGARAGSSAGTPPGSRRSRRCDRRSPYAARPGSTPGRCSTQARQRSPSMTPGRHDRAGRTHVDAPSARATSVGDRCRRHVRLVRRSGDHRSEHEPAPGTGDEQVGVLAEPAQPTEICHLPIDDRVVVGEGDCPLAGVAQALGDLPQTRPQRSVVVDPRVASDSRLCAGGPRGLLVGEVRPRGDDDRTGTRHGSGRISGTFRVAVRECHPGSRDPPPVEPPTPAAPDRGHPPEQHRDARCHGRAPTP